MYIYIYIYCHPNPKRSTHLRFDCEFTVHSCVIAISESDTDMDSAHIDLGPSKQNICFKRGFCSSYGYLVQPQHRPAAPTKKEAQLPKTTKPTLGGEVFVSQLFLVFFGFSMVFFGILW